ncbi:MAG TPA: TrmB family transcriptional regulator [Candidatus Aenigmarchaeota archaeon]|nr:TrmB family transcriptional regulator [Candidatus Aenigmarchaeota archaeon]
MAVTQTIGRAILEGLKGIGLNLYERNLYIAILIKKVATASELSELSNVPRARVYDVLESLEQKGFVVIQHGSPFKYIAIEPEQAFENLRFKILRDAEERSNRLEELKKSKIMKEMIDIYKRDLKLISPENFSGIIKSSDKIKIHVRSLLGRTKNYLNILTSEKGLGELTYHIRNFNKLKKNNVDIKILAPITSKNKSLVGELIPYAEIKDIQGVKAPYGKLHIFDGEHVVFGLVNDKEIEPSQEIVFWVQSQHVARDLMQPIFNHIWEKAKLIR